MHNLQCDDIDELDEINGDVQLALVWCSIHCRYEWHSIPRSQINRPVEYRTDGKPVEW